MPCAPLLISGDPSHYGESGPPMLSVKSLAYQWDELNLYLEMIRAWSLHFVIPQMND